MEINLFLAGHGTVWNWNPPVEYPDDGLFYIWNEETLTWVEI